MGFLGRLLALVAEAARAAGALAAGSQPCHNLAAALAAVEVLVAPSASAEPDGAVPASPSAGLEARLAQNREQLAAQRFPQALRALALGSSACPDAGVRAEVGGWVGQAGAGERPAVGSAAGGWCGTLPQMRSQSAQLSPATVQ